MHTPTNYLLARMVASDVFTIMMFAAHRFAFSQHVLMKISGTWFERHRPHYNLSRRKIQRFAQAFKNGIAIK